MVTTKQLVKSLVIFILVITCVKLSFNISVLKMADVVGFKTDEWSNIATHDANINLHGNVHYHKKLLKTVNEHLQKNTLRDVYNIITTAKGQTYDFPRQRHPQMSDQTHPQVSDKTHPHVSYQTQPQVSDNTRKTVALNMSTPFSIKFSSSRLHSSSTKQRNDIHMKVDKNNTILISKRLNVTYNSTKKKLLKKHPHELDFQMISSGKFILEDLMKQGPFKFLPTFKSPCWKSNSNGTSEVSIRCLPYFYLVGAPKSGTTDMHRRLIKHPEISKLVVKEPHWLTRRHYYNHGIKGGYSYLTHYLKIFTYATRDILMRRDSTGYHNVIFGDCSASTMWDNDYWTILPQYRNLSEPLYTNADYIHHLNPNTKIIAMLRNPVERLYSDYLFFQHGSPQKFHEGVVNIIKDTYECLKNNSLRHCVYTPAKSRTGVQIRLRIGIYHLHLKEYYRVFPSEQVMVIKLEHFSKNTVSYMKKIFSFLEISELSMKDLQKIADPDQHANKRRKKDKKAGEMLPETRKLLENFYRPHNDLLSNLLGEQFNYNRDFS